MKMESRTGSARRKSWASGEVISRKCGREGFGLGRQSIIGAFEINAVLAPPNDAAAVAFQQQMPEAAARVVGIAFKDGCQDGPVRA